MKYCFEYHLNNEYSIKIEFNIANYLEINKENIKKITNKKNMTFTKLIFYDLFQINSELKLNHLKWCINYNK